MGVWIDPAAAFTHLMAEEENAFWLDAGPDVATGWTVLGVGAPSPAGPGALAEEVRSVEAARPGRPTSIEGEWPAGPFRGGWVGWMGYEAGAAAAGAPARPDQDAPPAAWMAVTRYLAFDHSRRTVWAVAAPDEVSSWRARARRVGPLPRPLVAEPVLATARHSSAEYVSMIGRCREAIREGDAYQLCLTTRFTVEGAPPDPLQTFLRLRADTPAPRAGYVRFGQHVLISASPERFLRISDGIASTSPIKGTRPRGPSPDADGAFAAALATDAKERAENVMIVDLMRNDLSRVSVPGGIRVDRLLAVESYAHVHQLVSDVSGHLSAATTIGDVLDSTFPAGSMTGAPKLSAMTLLHGIERAPRGVFAGCFGWVGDDGDADLAMVIRSIVCHPNGAYVGAGGGITWRSRAPSEVTEVAVKARAPLAALGAQVPPGW